jgi:hypothetical protein
MSRQLQDKVSPVRVSTYCAQLERLHLWGTDEEIDSEFHAVCRQIWGYTVEDFDEDQLSREDHDFLDELTRRRAYSFALEHGYDLGDYANGEMVSDWWGFAWMVLAEQRGMLSPEQRAAAWKKHDERLLANEKVVAVIR